jgi:hypothetical protein
MKKLVIVLVATCGLAVVGDASARELGDRDTIAITGGAVVQSGSSPGSENTLILFSPNVHWFFADGLSLSVGADYVHSKSFYNGTMTEISDGVGGDLRFGGLVDLNDYVSLWPAVRFNLGTRKSTMSGIAYTQAADGSTTSTPYSYDSTQTYYGITAEVPIIVKLSKHTFASLSFASAGYQKNSGSEGQKGHVANFGVNAGVGLGIGGWF